MYSRDTGIPFALYAYAVSALARAAREKHHGLHLIRARADVPPVDDDFARDSTSPTEPRLFNVTPPARGVAAAGRVLRADGRRDV